LLSHEQLLHGKADCPFATDGRLRESLRHYVEQWKHQNRNGLESVRGHSLDNQDDRPPPSVALPDKIGGCSIDCELGRGAMGVVYQGHDPKLKRPVAIKVLLHGAHSRVSDRRRLIQEAQAPALLSHPNIIKVHDVRDTNDKPPLPCLILELANGRNLDEFRKAHTAAGRKWDVEDTVRLVHLLAKAVDYANRNGVLHRDLKPANILIHRPSAADDSSTATLLLGGELAMPKIGDFGIGKRYDETEQLTATEVAMGTPTFAAPELLSGKGKVADARADVYGLGGILYWLLTGQPPHEGKTAKEIEEDLLGRKGRLRWTRPVFGAVPPILAAICQKCLMLSRDDRYAAAKNLADDLRAFLDGEPTSVKPAGVCGRLTVAFAYSPRLARLQVWQPLFFCMAFLLLVENTALYFMQQMRAPDWVFALNSFAVGGMFVAFFFTIWKRTQPRGLGREVLLMIGTAAASTVLIAALCGIINDQSWKYYNLGWSFGCVCNAQATTLIAQRLKKFYEVPVLFCVVAFLTAWWMEEAPLIFGVSLFIILGIAGLQVEGSNKRVRPPQV
jgi:hypothetical protein